MKIRRSSLVQVQSEGRTFAARIVDVDSDRRCDVMVVALSNVDRSIMVARSAIVAVDLF